MEYLLLDTHDPALNLATEERLFETLDPAGAGLFLLWRNGPSVIVGRHQCTAEEIDADFVARENLPVVRRNTGGGAVYHDLGNVNFSFLVPTGASKAMDFSRYMEPVRLALQDIGVEARITGRNDMEIEGRKISGSAQLVRGGKTLHHGTLLVDVDLERMAQALAVDPEKIRSKGVASLRARVDTIAAHWPADTTMEMLQDALVARCADAPGRFTREDQDAAEALAQAKYRQWDWNYGASPPYTERIQHRFPWGKVDVRLDVERGTITACRIFGDFFALAPMGELEERLAGSPRDPEALAPILETLPWRRWFGEVDPAQIADLFRT
jgi:lipoate-protein ligase A